MVEVDLTFDKAIKIIQAIERVDQSTHVMQNSHGAVNFSTKPRTKSVEKRSAHGPNMQVSRGHVPYVW